ncbi:hypothetical protein J2S43_005193 [Catenuloplanes nepalensis]|uniref:Uncharacterized protein n=1 Tax=Catenuloplanes nepalensis TaxID=587533 RepID=A0ABT9MZQ6_9ACTN|nr:hypothetical protein [Catenuloplanes nepalensis]MDP9796681.1 hypothetical protein [Catenuloplanes nepalensis]
MRTRTVPAAVLIGSLSGGVAAAAPAVAADPKPAFAADRTFATWDGTLLKVEFRETGAAPWSTGPVSIRATGHIDVTCVGGGVSLTSQASAETEVVSEHRADGSGVRVGEQVIGLAVQPPVITGLDCRPTLSRSFTVTVQDLATGAVQTLAGPATSSDTGITP